MLRRSSMHVIKNTLIQRWCDIRVNDTSSQVSVNGLFWRHNVHKVKKREPFPHFHTYVELLCIFPPKNFTWVYWRWQTKSLIQANQRSVKLNKVKIASKNEYQGIPGGGKATGAYHLRVPSVKKRPVTGILKKIIIIHDIGECNWVYIFRCSVKAIKRYFTHI